MRVLGIESSCDETGVAIYDTDAGLLSHQLFSQVDLHARYGGVVPELASRDHVQRLIPLIDQAFLEAGLARGDVDGVAYTAGPGLIGALMVGAMVGRSLAWAWGCRQCRSIIWRGICSLRCSKKAARRFPLLPCLYPAGIHS